MATHVHLTTAFSSLLTAAIHTILYERVIYPRASFLSTRFHNYPVHQSRHPLVCQWINDAVTSISKLVADGTAKHVVVVIFDAQHVPMERFVFDVDRFPVVAPKDREMLLERGELEEQEEEQDEAEVEKAHDRVSVEISESFRAVLARLNTVSSKLRPLPPDCSFTVAVELKDEAAAPIGHPQPWIPSEPSMQISGTRADKEAQGAKMLPVRTIEAGEMLLEVWVEEGKAKLEKAVKQTQQSSKASSSSMKV